MLLPHSRLLIILATLPFQFFNGMAGDVAVKRWEQLIASPPAPDAIRRNLEDLDEERPSSSNPSALSTWYRAKAVLTGSLPDASFDEALVLLNQAYSIASDTPQPLSDDLKRKALLNKSAVARRFLDNELQRSVLYGFGQEDFFRLMTDYYRPANMALIQGMELVREPIQRIDFLLAQSALALSLAHCAQTFTPDSPLVHSLYQDAAQRAQDVIDALNASSVEDVALRRAALNNIALAVVELSPSPAEKEKLANALLVEARDPQCPLHVKAACLATVLHLARSLYADTNNDKILIDATNLGVPLFEELLDAQRILSGEIGETGYLQPLFDDYSHFVSSLVLGLVELNDKDRALSVVRRSKWSTLASVLGPPEIDHNALRKRLAERKALLVEQFLSHEGLIQFIIAGDGSVALHRDDSRPAYALAYDIAAHHRNSGSASPVRLLLRGRNTLYVENLKRGNLLYHIVLVDSGVASRFDEFDEILIAPHLILSYISYAGIPVEVNMDDPLASRMLCEVAPPISFIPSSLLFASQTEQYWSEEVRYYARSDFQNQDPTYGSDLPGVPEEVKACYQVLPGPLKLDAEATEAVFWETAHEARILYLASHGIAKRESPLQSQILLAQTNSSIPSEDGYLTVGELLHVSLTRINNPIRPELAVLSACVTALSESRPMYSDAMVSLARAMLAAGCQNVIATLWDAHDQTYARLMPAMLKHTSDGVSPPAALWRAQASYLKEMRAGERISPLAAPMFWASAACFGRL